MNARADFANERVAAATVLARRNPVRMPVTAFRLLGMHN